MTEPSLGAKQFLWADQDAFARLSGDANPMHMDALAARRTQAGAPVVHGIHNTLYALEKLAAAHPDLPAVATLKASFNKMVYVGDRVDYLLAQKSDTAATVDICVEGTSVARLIVTFGAPRPPKTPLAEGAEVQRPTAPAVLDIAGMGNQSGRVGIPGTPEAIAAMFPAAAALWSAGRLVALVCTTALVGMVCPGLHSIYAGFTLNAWDAAAGDNVLSWRSGAADPRFRMVRLTVASGGVWGTIDSFARMPPTTQKAIPELAGLVAQNEFGAATALVLGGSRGMGELTAKFLAAGGARVIITYAAGRQDAETVAAHIRAHGGECDVMAYDVLKPAVAQLGNLPVPPTHLYYFATPPIFRRKSGLFVAARYATLNDFYVSGFYDLFMALHAAAPNGLAAFYPSSVAVDDRPADMTEYAMAKLAGETLCHDMNAHLTNARIVIHRLPRLPTDQTATVVQAESADPVKVMLPIIRAVQG